MSDGFTVAQHGDPQLLSKFISSQGRFCTEMTKQFLDLPHVPLQFIVHNPKLTFLCPSSPKVFLCLLWVGRFPPVEISSEFFPPKPLQPFKTRELPVNHVKHIKRA